MAEYGPDDLLNATQAATVAGVDRRTIIAWIHNGWLVGMKHPGSRGRYLVKYSDLVDVAYRRYVPKGE